MSNVILPAVIIISLGLLASPPTAVEALPSPPQASKSKKHDLILIPLHQYYDMFSMQILIWELSHMALIMACVIHAHTKY